RCSSVSGLPNPNFASASAPYRVIHVVEPVLHPFRVMPNPLPYEVVDHYHRYRRDMRMMVLRGPPQPMPPIRLDLSTDLGRPVSHCIGIVRGHLVLEDLPPFGMDPHVRPHPRDRIGQPEPPIIVAHSAILVTSRATP